MNTQTQQKEPSIALKIAVAASLRSPRRSCHTNIRHPHPSNKRLLQPRRNHHLRAALLFGPLVGDYRGGEAHAIRHLLVAPQYSHQEH